MWPFESRIANMGFGLALVILVVISLGSYRTIFDLEKSAQWKVQSQEGMRTISGVLTLLRRAEGDRRGYLITGNEDFMKSYPDAVQAIPLQIEKVRSLTAGNPDQQKLLGDLEPLVAQKLSNLQESVNLLKGHKGDQAAQAALTEKGKEVMDRIQLIVNRMITVQTDLLGRRDVETRRGARFSVAVSAAGDALAFSLLVLVFYLLNREIAHRKRGQAVIRKLNEDLQRRATELASANEELESFAYSLSHDLRTPLQNIDLCITLLEDYGQKLGAEGADYLQRIRAAERRMADLIESLLKLSKTTMAELRREPVDLSGTARTILAELQGSRPARKADFVVSPGIIVNGDLQLLKIAMENLLGNAWKFTSQQPQAKIEVGVKAGAEGGNTYFVRDNGAGFDMGKAGKLFIPFQRLHDPGLFEGIGIGLATVQRIIHRHGGRIWAEAEPGKGATFYFTLP